MNKLHNIIVVVGPTASGKSDFAVELALQYNGEIISADSRQVFKGLDIGTGKITQEEMNNVRHHMLSVYDLTDEISVARFARDAEPILQDIFSRNKTPIICGGTGQYIDALIYNQLIPKVEPNKKLREDLEKLSTKELITSLTARDPIRLATIDTHNRPRLIRALEIIEKLGHVPKQKDPELLYNTTLYLMNPTRELLRTRITKRLERRLDKGMTEEVKSLMEKGYTSTSMKKFGLEYTIIGEHLEEKLSYEEMKEKLITKSMQYAKRQQTWNKKYIPIATIIDVKE